MNRILFGSALVCVFCMAATEFLFAGEGLPKPSPLAQNCISKSGPLEKVCTDPATDRWNLTEYMKHPEGKPIPIRRMCCFIFDASACFVHNIPSVKCNSTEEKAYKDYMEEYEKYADDHDCISYPRKSQSVNCKL